MIVLCGCVIVIALVWRLFILECDSVARFIVRVAIALVVFACDCNVVLCSVVLCVGVLCFVIVVVLLGVAGNVYMLI